MFQIKNAFLFLIFFVLLNALLFVFLLFILFSYSVLRNSEATLAAEQYVSVTTGALNNAQSLAENKLVHGSRIMAKHVGWAFPDANQDWPLVWLSSYWDIMEEVLPTSIYSGLNLAPIVAPEQASSFEDYAYSKIAETFGENSTMGESSHFGKGIWVKDEKRVHTVDSRYHDTTGVPIYSGSPYNYMAPKLQDGLTNLDPHLMMNVHGFETQGLALDAVMNCSIARKENYINYVALHGEPEKGVQFDAVDAVDTPNPKESHCSALSGILPPKNIHDDEKLGIAGFLATPIYPANDPYELVGYIYGIVYWVEVLCDIFPKDAIGIDCVFGDDDPNSRQYTYTLDGSGTAVMLCEGDCHDENYDDMMITTTIIDPTLLSEGSISYHMTCYPNEKFFKTYQTSNPMIAAIGAIGIIIFTSVLFFFYDFFVRREFRSKKELFEAKRKFVRFVSHEVRTPMNSVIMGLNVLQEEAAMTLGYDLRDKNGDYKQKKHNKQQQPSKPCDRAQVETWFDLTNEISANAQASVDVLDDFLNYDKIATGEMVLEYTIIPIYNLIQDTVAEFKLPMTKKSIRLHKSLPNNDGLKRGSSHSRSGFFFSDDTFQRSNRRRSKIDLSASKRSSQSRSSSLSLFCSDDAIQKSNMLKTNKDDQVSDMELGRKSDVLETTQKQKLVGDSVRITQVIRNLVSNAIKFSREGGDIYVSTTLVKRVGGRKRRRAEAKKMKKTFEMKSKEVITCEMTGEIVFTIKDSGAGLSRTQLKNLFGAGVQFDVNELQSGKGSGLGLYIAKGIVEQHGGSLVADSDGKGLGCTFTLRLPIYAPPEDVWDSSQLFWKRRRPRTRDSFERAIKQKTVKEGDYESDGEMEDCTLKSLDSRDDGMSELKILLVDDSKSNRKLLDRLMTMRGHRCEQAEDGHIGLEMTMTAESFGQPYDLIFMDYEMPTMNGPEAVKHIRSQGSKVYIIGLTGNIMADDVSYFHACGANAVFPKPFKVREFEELLEENLARDSKGRIIERASTAFELSTLGLTMENPSLMMEHPSFHLSFGDIDDTGTSSLETSDPCDERKSPSSSPSASLELDYEAAKRALRDVSC